MREATQVARATAADGDTAAALAITGTSVDGTVVAVGGLANLNTVVNSNRVFINALEDITSLDC